MSCLEWAVGFPRFPIVFYVLFRSIRAYDTSKVDKGPVFQVEVTVIKPIIMDPKRARAELAFDDVLFGPNTMKRHFIKVPKDVTWAGKIFHFH